MLLDKAVIFTYQMEDQSLSFAIHLFNYKMNDNVPQPEDWVRAWRLCLTTTGVDAAEATEHVINPMRQSGIRYRGDGQGPGRAEA
jgi:hypothetical protein